MTGIVVLLALATGSEWVPGRDRQRAEPALPSELPREVLALSRIRRKVTERLERQANFTCLETTERWTQASPNVKPRQIDTIRFEVAHAGGKELYAYPGARSFDESPPGELIASGTASSGAFTSHLRSIFGGGATIRFSGDEEINGRATLRYGFQTPLMFNRMTITVGGRSGDASTKGTFWADAVTFDVLRVRVEAADIPPDVPAANFVTTIDYGMSRIANRDEWIPQRSEFVLTHLSGRQDRNFGEYTHCREYAGASVLRFDAVNPGEDARPAPAVEEVMLPEGLSIEVLLETPIDSATAAVGDPLTAVVAQDVTPARPVKRAKGKSDGAPEPAVPKGAILRGRLRLLMKETAPVPHSLVGLEFVELEFAGKRAVFYGKLSGIGPFPAIKTFLSGPAKVRTTRYIGLTGQSSSWESTAAPDLPGLATFFVEGGSFRLPKGLRMVWRTATVSK